MDRRSFWSPYYSLNGKYIITSLHIIYLINGYYTNTIINLPLIIIFYIDNLKCIYDLKTCKVEKNIFKLILFHFH